MQDKMDKQSDIIMKQQLFLENVDRKERETKLIVRGVPEETDTLDGATSDEEKLSKIWSRIGATVSRISSKRLGNTALPDRKRPILVIVRSKEERDSVLEKAKLLKNSEEAFKTIYIRKDVHPAVRKEWERLRHAENDERNRPENRGCVIRLDTKERKLYRNDEVIDSWNPHPF